ncbi:MAG: SGNH/GDSL hydrolase family protein [Christensenellales bacterium]|jgi:lysophospholipase L1-like esterase
MEKTLRCLMLGDSIVWYDGQVTLSGPEEIQKAYPSYIREAGFDFVQNEGVSGSCLRDNPHSPTPSVPAVAATLIFSPYQLVCVVGGVNDFYAASPLGDFTPANTDIQTVYGSLNFLAQKMQKENPKGTLLYFTPLPCDDQDKPNTLGLRLQDYSDAIRTIAKTYNCPVLDLSNIQGYDLKQMTLDGLHPNNKGYALVNKQLLAPFIKDWITKHNRYE